MGIPYLFLLSSYYLLTIFSCILVLSEFCLSSGKSKRVVPYLFLISSLVFHGSSVQELQSSIQSSEFRVHISQRYEASRLGKPYKPLPESITLQSSIPASPSHTFIIVR